MTNEQIAGIIVTAFIAGIFLGGVVMAALRSASKRKSLSKNIHLN